MKAILLSISTLVINQFSFTQDFVNGDLESAFLKISELPQGWEAVHYTEKICHAEQNFQATPDLTDKYTIASKGIMGTPQSGESFISALDLGPGMHHEGIQQTLTGLIPGMVYRIHFYQAVIKQENCLDTSGAWAIFQDDEMVQISSVSTSLMAYDSLETQWDKRSVEFEAKSTSHTIKFLPWDDDNVFNGYDENGFLRMGIDNISLEEVIDMDLIDKIEMSVYPNPTLDQFSVQTELEKYQLIISDMAGRIILDRMNCSYITPVELDQRGVFLVTVRTETQQAVKKVIIQ
ncbi:T9SS type A sorting domain-containing protein [Paracrocinitomix mangrovi]|uniref:T9SS type A sorting domain-containing protein n=1 Tax=Paracrocinitomix mangrovi TaxID=2862509 RepID=UPI001C8EE256|nr:T9SS type A sorting domain-containing protein [Paracrocinitomix mangrovi]UKN03149.1 T9SS type A sorting domain-containing protein [Paracrocinitomix mangrovi]